jgi:aspartate-semialdehyde dehydrogenase
MNQINVGIVGATGMVGEVFLSLLEERDFPVGELRLFASQNSLGRPLKFRGREVQVQTLSPDCFNGLNLVFFSSGDDISKEWAPVAARAGAWAVDNSAAFRMDPHAPLVVPEVNGHLLKEQKTPGIIANPNCSTIQLVVALQPLLKRFGLQEVRVASYQSVSGAGRPAVEELSNQVQQYLDGRDLEPKNFPHGIAFNCIPQIGSFDPSGFCTEELKIMRETRKILSQPELRVSAFTVRVPTFNSHAEAVWVTLGRDAAEDEVLSCLQDAPGLVLERNWAQAKYPMMSNASGMDPVYVGRVRRDLNDSKTWLMWVVADNIRKGAALNGIQIAEMIYQIRR